VIEYLGQKKIIAGDLIQSGGIINDLWKVPLKKLITYNLNLKTILILGLGGGTVVKMLVKKFPDSQITAVEIDPEMIDIAQKYFGMDKIPKLNIIQADAFKWVRKTIPSSDKFDLILVDLFAGKLVPKQLKTVQFYQDINNILNPNGIIICNCLFYGDYKKETETIVRVIGKEFKDIELVRHLSNLFVMIVN
jgi:spermidine synthase